VKYLMEEEHTIVSGEHPYELRAGHKEGKDLEYGGLEKYKSDVKKEVQELEKEIKVTEKKLNLR